MGRDIMRAGSALGLIRSFYLTLVSLEPHSRPSDQRTSNITCSWLLQSTSSNLSTSRSQKFLHAEAVMEFYQQVPAQYIQLGRIGWISGFDAHDSCGQLQLSVRSISFRFACCIS